MESTYACLEQFTYAGLEQFTYGELETCMPITVPTPTWVFIACNPRRLAFAAPGRSPVFASAPRNLVFRARAV